MFGSCAISKQPHILSLGPAEKISQLVFWFAANENSVYLWDIGVVLVLRLRNIRYADGVPFAHQQCTDGFLVGLRALKAFAHARILTAVVWGREANMNTAHLLRPIRRSG